MLCEKQTVFIGDGTNIGLTSVFTWSLLKKRFPYT